MGLSGGVPAATAGTVVLDPHVVLGLLEGESHFLPSEDVSVEILTEDLGCFIIDFVLGIDHDAILGACLVEDLANDF